MSQTSSALLGALVADAAGLGLHWLYDVGRIASIVEGHPPAFVPIDPANFKDVAGYFAHGNRRDGQLSQYGETLALVMRSIVENNGFDTTQYQQAFAAHFGPGGTYVGYIDRPTRGTLINIANEQLRRSGIDDDQHPAITTLPAIVARYGNDPAQLKAAREVTNVNAMAQAYGEIIADALSAVIEGTPLREALATGAEHDPLLAAALKDTGSSVDYGEITSRACHLNQGTPLSWHILANTNDYKDAVETNIKAGGDSAGRAMIVGALAGAAYGAESIPQDWIDRTENIKTLTDLAHSV